ncbi:mCG147024 [Mus musculus]|nr:mCG147024 [Mus musculus]
MEVVEYQVILPFCGASSHLNPPFPEHFQSIDSILIREISWI